ncbi:MAG TPA: Crp/Fnr family transcriptional regulator [Deltaproteobacteria bacterium]|nr:Crp/Fnr family transcriptional regulator [Deltaproteobacteria bacterium]
MKSKNSLCAICHCYIKENTLFADLTEEQLDDFKDVVVISSFRKRDIVYLEGDPCTGLYVVRTGRVKLVRSSAAGKEQIIRILYPGDLLGMEVLYDGAVYANTAVAMDNCELCYIKRESFLAILDRSPGVARKLIFALGRELNQAYERIGTLGLMNAREKLAHLLCTLADEYGEKVDGQVRLNLTLSRLEIAELLGITQETSIRLLKAFKDDGIIDIRRKEIIIKSVERLKAVGESMA